MSEIDALAADIAEELSGILRENTTSLQRLLTVAESKDELFCRLDGFFSGLGEIQNYLNNKYSAVCE